LQAEITAREAQDPLTGVLNRRHIDKRLKALIQSKTPAVLVLVDVDRLNRINEDQGFAAGDATIHALADILKARLPNAACAVGRYESDSFLLLLPGVELDHARECITICHETFVGNPVIQQGMTLQAGFSAGLVDFPADAQSESELIQCLDLTMFLTRHEGGNRILSYDDARKNIF